MALSLTQAFDLFAKRVAVYDLLEQDASSGGGTLELIRALLVLIADNDWSQSVRDDADAFRASLAGLVEGTSVRTTFTDIVREMAGSTNVDSERTKDGSIEDLFEDVYDFMVDNGLTVLSRAQTYGPVVPDGGNTGDGDFYRLSIGEDSEPLEGWFADVYEIICVDDGRATGDEEETFFEVSGTAESVDELERAGSGVVRERFKALNARDAQAYIQNPSFTSQGGTPESTPTSVTGWTPGSGDFSNYEIDDTNGYRPEPGGGAFALRSLRQIADDILSQPLTTVNAAIDFEQPFLISVAVRRNGLADGVVTLRLADGVAGGVFNTLDLTTLAQDEWGILLLSVPGQDSWPRSWNANNLTLSVDLAGNAAESASYDDVQFSPFFRVGAFGDSRSGRGAMGHYVAVRGGQTPFVEGDKAEFTDADDPTRAKLQYWAAVSSLGYFPSDAAPTFPDA